MRKAYLLVGVIMMALIATKAALLAAPRSNDTRLDGWEETASWRRTDVPPPSSAEYV
jgi:hypothetical protein